MSMQQAQYHLRSPAQRLEGTGNIRWTCQGHSHLSIISNWAVTPTVVLRYWLLLAGCRNGYHLYGRFRSDFTA
jgi:hypothetical protein